MIPTKRERVISRFRLWVLDEVARSYRGEKAIPLIYIQARDKDIEEIALLKNEAEQSKRLDTLVREIITAYKKDMEGVYDGE